MKMLMRKWAASIALLVVSAPASGIADEIKEKYFSLTIPVGFKIENTTLVEDAQTYVVTDGKVPYLRIYVGNAPHYPEIKGATDDEIASLGTPTSRFNSKWNHGVMAGAEFLDRRMLTFDWPLYVHAWTAEEAVDRNIALKILMSLRVDE